MAISLKVSDTLKFKVKGTTKDEHGIDQPFDFWLTAERSDQDEVRSFYKNEADMLDVLVSKVTDWTGVKDSDGKQVPYSAENLRALCKLFAGLTYLTFNTYLSEVGAKTKN